MSSSEKVWWFLLGLIGLFIILILIPQGQSLPTFDDPTIVNPTIQVPSRL